MTDEREDEVIELCGYVVDLCTEVKQLRYANFSLLSRLAWAELKWDQTNAAVDGAYQRGYQDGKSGEIPISRIGPHFWQALTAGTA